MKKIMSIGIVAMFIGMMFVGISSAQFEAFEVGTSGEIVYDEYKTDLTCVYNEPTVDGKLTYANEYGAPRASNIGRTEYYSDIESINSSAEIVISIAEFGDNIYLLFENKPNVTYLPENSTVITSFMFGFDSDNDDELDTAFMVRYNGTTNFIGYYSDKVNNIVEYDNDSFELERSVGTSSNIEAIHDMYELSFSKNLIDSDIILNVKFEFIVAISQLNMNLPGMNGGNQVSYFPIERIANPDIYATFMISAFYPTFSYYDIESINEKDYVLGVVTKTDVSVNETSDIEVKSNYNFVFDSTRTLTIEFENFEYGSLWFGMSFNGGAEKLGGWFPDSIVYVWIDGDKRQLTPECEYLKESSLSDVGYEFNIPDGKELTKIQLILKPSIIDKLSMMWSKNL